MGPLVVRRRRFLRGLASLAVCAPAVVRASNLMEVSAKFCGSSHMTLPSAATHEALALLQQEMERRFGETLFGADSTEVEESIGTRRLVIAEAKITALWQLRTSFGPRGSPPKLLEDLPAEVRAGLSSMFGAGPDESSGAWTTRFSGPPAHKSGLRAI